MHTITSLQNDLRAMGILPDDTLLIHSSMKSIGAVENGADGVLDALIQYFVPGGGLLIFPTLTYHLNAENPVFVVEETAGIVGLLPELFRKRPGVKRSWHPTHSVAAIGEGAAEYLAGHHLFDSPCAPTSPWGKLIDRKAKILFIGTGIICNTFLHGVEEIAQVPGMLTEEPQQLCTIAPDGTRYAVPSRRHLGHHSTWYEKIRQDFETDGVLTKGRFGDARCDLGDAAGMAETALRNLRQDPQYFTHF